MRYLLDTHILLWWITDDPALPIVAGEIIDAEENDLFVSSITLWEIAVKAGLGKLDADVSVISSAIGPAGLAALDFRMADAVEVKSLAMIHRDPFDRALIAQARQNGLRLLTVDEDLRGYGSPVLVVR
jgi:PIN domain nuclease of toxin-antitoxin system